jgi:hypothetical protein
MPGPAVSLHPGAIDYATRIGHILGSPSGGFNANHVLVNSTVYYDGAADELFGEGGTDWFLPADLAYSYRDLVRDAESGETVTCHS